MVMICLRNVTNAGESSAPSTSSILGSMQSCSAPCGHDLGTTADVAFEVAVLPVLLHRLREAMQEFEEEDFWELCAERRFEIGRDSTSVSPWSLGEIGDEVGQVNHFVT